MNHTTMRKEHDGGMCSLRIRDKHDRKPYCERFEPTVYPVEPSYDDEPVQFPNLASMQTRQSKRNCDSPSDSTYRAGRQRISVEYDAPVNRVRRRDRSPKLNSPEQILLKYGIINPKNTSTSTFRDQSNRKSKIKLSDLVTVDSTEKKTDRPRHDRESPQYDSQMTSDGLILQHIRSKSVKCPDSMGSPFTVTRKQLNPKYNYIDMESLEKEESMFYEMAQKRLKEFHEKAERLQVKMPTLKQYRENVSQYEPTVESGNPQRNSSDFKPLGSQKVKPEYSQHQLTRYPKSKPWIDKVPLKRNRRAFTPWKDSEEGDLFSLVQ